jgi:hypothetical protein
VRTKSAYRKPAENNPPAVEAVIAPAPEAPAVAAVEVRPEPEPQPESSQVDEAALALKKRVEELRQSEALLRQAAQPIPQPPTREQVLASWKAQGMSADDEAFLAAHPELIDGYQLTVHAANEAAKEHNRGTAEHREATLRVFNEALAQAQAQAQQQESAMKTTPEFFQPPPPPKPRTAPSIVSAPVSREVPTGGPRPEFEENPTRVILSAAEKEVARASKISEVEYARNKIRMMRMKAEGQIQG